MCHRGVGGILRLDAQSSCLLELMVVHRARLSALRERGSGSGDLHPSAVRSNLQWRNPQREKALTAFAIGLYSHIAYREALMFNANSALAAGVRRGDHLFRRA